MQPKKRGEKTQPSRLPLDSRLRGNDGRRFEQRAYQITRDSLVYRSSFLPPTVIAATHRHSSEGWNPSCLLRLRLHDFEDLESLGAFGEIDADSFTHSCAHECFTHRRILGDFDEIEAE